MTSHTLPIRSLGSRGPAVTRIGLGLAALGRPAYHNLGHGQDLAGRQDRDALEAHCHAVLDGAWEAGIRVVDVARSYGDAEAFIRRWIDARGLPDDAIRVGSKWGYTYVGDWSLDAEIHERKDHGLPTFTRQAAETRATLGDALDVYCIHSVTPDGGVLDDLGVLDAMSAFCRAHGVRMGLTVTGPEQARTLQRVVADHADRFDVVHATFNLLDPSAGPALAEAHAAGLGVVVKEGVANGRLTARSDLDAVLTVLAPLAAKHGCTPDAVALGWILAHDAVDVVLSGASTLDQLHSNLAATTLALDAEDLAALDTLAMTPTAYWSARRGLAWT